MILGPQNHDFGRGKRQPVLCGNQMFWEGLKNGILKAFKISVGYDWPQGFYNYEHSFRAAPLAGYRRGIIDY